MKILVDGMGGDYSPEEIVKGVVKAAAEIDETVLIIGPEHQLSALLDKYKAGNNIVVIDAPEVIRNEEAPAMAIRKKKHSTIVKGMEMLKQGDADVFISAGSTGALLAGSLLLLGCIKGIKRPAIAAWLPTTAENGETLLLDCGANSDCKEEYLYQFGLMGSLFVKSVKGIDTPIVKLLNVGAEEGKGDTLHKKAYELFSDGPFEFQGNIEGRDVLFSNADVVVADGFSGNVFLKTCEGTVQCLTGILKNKLSEGILAKTGSAFAHGKLKEVKSTFDYSNAGGAPILGIKGAVLKIHGNAKEKDVYNAILKAVPFVNNDVTGMIEKAITSHENN